MWFIGLAYWIAFGLLYGVHTGLNIYSHFKSRETRAVRGEDRGRARYIGERNLL